MILTNELLLGLGFTEMETSWADDHCRIYKNQLPETLEEFKKILTGKAYNKALKRGRSEGYQDVNVSNPTFY